MAVHALRGSVRMEVRPHLGFPFVAGEHAVIEERPRNLAHSSTGLAQTPPHHSRMPVHAKNNIELRRCFAPLCDEVSDSLCCPGAERVPGTLAVQYPPALLWNFYLNNSNAMMLWSNYLLTN